MVVASPPPSPTPVTSRSATVARSAAAVDAFAAPPLSACVAASSAVLHAAFSAD